MDQPRSEASALQALVQGLQAWAATAMGALSTQVWVADDLGFHLRASAGRDSSSSDRHSARRCCLDDQTVLHETALALPIKLSERRSGACVFALARQADTEQIRACRQQLQAVAHSLDEALQSERIARLSGTARLSDQLRACLARSHALEHCQQLRPALAELRHSLNELLPTDNFFVISLDETRQWLQFEYFADQNDKDEAPIPFHEGRLQGSLAAFVVAAGRVVRGSSQELLEQAGLSDTQDSKQFGPSAYDWLGAPMQIAGEVLGAIVVQSYRPEIRFHDTAPSVLSMVAEAVGAALHRRRGRESLERTVAARTAELRQSLAQLRATQTQLVNAEKHAALGRLVSGVAHELNTPLGIALTANSHLQESLHRFKRRQAEGALRRSDLSELTQALGDCGGLLSTSLERAIGLVQRFKQIAASERRQLAEPRQLRQLLSEIVTSLQPRVQQHGHRLNLDCSTDLEVPCVPDVWLEVIGQLVDNAISHAYSSPGGRMTLQVERAGNGLLFRFRDNGCGFSDEAQQRAFDPFFTTARQRGHVGLGLHLLHNIVSQLFNGAIELHQPADGGSEIRWSFALEAVVETSDATAVLT